MGVGGFAWTTPALKEVQAGIEKVASRLKAAGDGRPRLFLLRDSLVRRDPLLEEAKKPTCTEEEIDSYVWDEVSGGRLGERVLEQPRPMDDHGMDAMRYMVMYFEDPARYYASVIGQKIQLVEGPARQAEAPPTRHADAPTRQAEASLTEVPRDEMDRQRAFQEYLKRAREVRR